MAITYKKMKTYTVPDGNDKVQYEIVDDAGRKMIAPDWDVSYDEAFAVGDYVVNDGKLYRFTSAHTAGDAWDDEEVTEITVTDEIQAIKSDVSGKASKVSGATSGHFAGLDANGNPTDSGYSVGTGSPSDSKLWSSQTTFSHMSNFLAMKADKVTGATENNFAALDENGNLKDSGKSASDFVASSDFTADKMPMSASDSTKVATEVTELKSQIDGKASIIRDTVTNVPIATVPDGAAVPLSALKIAVEPVQDLHGQINPYPAGGGKNLLPMSLTSIKAINTTGTWSNNVYTLSEVTFTVQTDDGGDVTGIAVNGTASNNAEFNIAENITSLAGLTVILNGATDGSDSTYVLQAYHWNGTNSSASRTGDSVSFTPTAAFDKVRIVVSSGAALSNKIVKPMIRLSSVTDGTFAPYSNICPITGRTGCEVDSAGANLISLDDLISAPSGVIGSYTFKHKLYLQLEPNTDYTLMTTYDGANNVLYFDGYTANDTVKASSPKTRTSNSSGQLIVGLYDRSGVEEFENETVIVALCKATEKKSYPITWQTEAGTVYGGTLTVNGDGTGEIVADRVYFVPTTLSYVGTASTGVQYGSCPLSVNNKNESLLSDNNNISSAYKLIKSAPSTSGWFRVNNGTLFIYDDRFTDLSTARSIVGTEQPQFVYEIATPIIIPLTNLPSIKTLLGNNNLWADCGNILLMEYGCDTKTYVEKRLTASQALMELIVTANRESEMKASKAYSSGNLLIVNGTLYRATTSIANGATLTPGTNVTATTVAAELAALA